MADALMDAGYGVRAVVRNPARAHAWRARGAEVAVADVHDVAALTAAYAGMEGVFVMIPPNFSPEPGYPDAGAITRAFRQALAAASPGKVVALSSIGAQHGHGLGLITQLHLLEQALADLPIPVAFLRPAWFMENADWDIASARQEGVLHSFLQPLEQAYPMVATDDIGRVAASVMRQSWQGRRIIEIEGPQRYSQLDIAQLLGQAIGHEVKAQTVPRTQWESRFQLQGTAWPQPRIEMLDGFNSGWIDFEGGTAEHVQGTTQYPQVLKALCATPKA